MKRYSNLCSSSALWRTSTSPISFQVQRHPAQTARPAATGACVDHNLTTDATAAANADSAARGPDSFPLAAYSTLCSGVTCYRFRPLKR